MTANVHNICKVWTKSSLLFLFKTMNAIKLMMFYGEYDVQLHYVGEHIYRIGPRHHLIY